MTTCYANALEKVRTSLVVCQSNHSPTTIVELICSQRQWSRKTFNLHISAKTCLMYQEPSIRFIMFVLVVLRFFTELPGHACPHLGGSQLMRGRQETLSPSGQWLGGVKQSPKGGAKHSESSWNVDQCSDFSKMCSFIFWGVLRQC